MHKNSSDFLAKSLLTLYFMKSVIYTAIRHHLHFCHDVLRCKVTPSHYQLTASRLFDYVRHAYKALA